MAADANPNLAIWISAIGFAATLLGGVAVAVINSITTLKGKKIDAQLKKDEQSYGFRMEYYKRKLSAGEKAIGVLSMLLTHLETLKSDFKGYLEHEATSEGDAKARNEELLTYQSKYLEAVNQSDNYYTAYFPSVKEDGDYNTLVSKLGAEQYKINYLIEQFDIESDKYFEENKDTDMLTKQLTEDKDFIDFLITEYIKTNDELQTTIQHIMDNIHEEMKDFIDAS